MLVLWLIQALFGVTALSFCITAAVSAVRGQTRTSYRLSLAGAFALVFFLSVPHVRAEVLVIAFLAVVAGFLMMPSQRRDRAEQADDAIEIDFDSTATRRGR